MINEKKVEELAKHLIDVANEGMNFKGWNSRYDWLDEHLPDAYDRAAFIYLADYILTREAAIQEKYDELEAAWNLAAEDWRRTEAAMRELIDGISEALTNEGVNPEYHRMILERHKSEWPVLWARLARIESWRSSCKK